MGTNLSMTETRETKGGSTVLKNLQFFDIQPSINKILRPQRFSQHPRNLLNNFDDFPTHLSRYFILRIFIVLFVLDLARPSSCLSCYVCGGSTGRPCADIMPKRRSPYIRYISWFGKSNSSLFNCLQNSTK